MTGPEHYREAERLIAVDDLHDPPTSGNIALAQVHATLALAAATALNDSGEMPLEDLHAWKDAASAEPAEDGELP